MQSDSLSIAATDFVFDFDFDSVLYVLILWLAFGIYTVSHKKHTKIVLVISSTKLNQFL